MLVSGFTTGFHNTLVSKCLLFALGGGTIASSILRWKPYLSLILNPHLTRDYQFWRLVTSQLAFANSGELLFGSLLLYQCRVIERHYGSAKFAAFVLLTSVTAKLLELGFLVSGNSIGLNSLPPGPYGLIFATLYQFYRIIPSTYKFRILGVSLTDKSYMYLLALQFLALNYPTSLIPALCGILAGILYQTDMGGLKRWRFPASLTRLASNWLKPLLATSTAPTSSAATLDQAYSSRARRDHLIQRTMFPQTQQMTDLGQSYMETMTEGMPQPIREEHIVALMTMFPNLERSAVVTALQSSNNDVNAAATLLLEQN
ncbi:hypothetical protein H4R34_003590 [Dimargaris verticillata]|uniref:CUE domain-containing protein n=1 Tax=Dimargaris verticillata TaxID=2761393 RepID=A0A9W8ECH0_9FUNG|nr:hypothetical protein H4R34_003590 [Dimargaris verticillata]